MNWTEFDRELRRVLASRAAFRILDSYYPGLTWTEGGCRLLGEALLIFFRARGLRASMRCICSQVEPPDWIEDHVVVKVGDRYLDADGVRGEEELLDGWSMEERSGAPTKICKPVERDGTIAGATPGYQHSVELAELLLEKLP